MFKLIEPALLIVVAAFVGFIVVALFLPLMEIMSSVGATEPRRAGRARVAPDRQARSRCARALLFVARSTSRCSAAGCASSPRSTQDGSAGARRRSTLWRTTCSPRSTPAATSASRDPALAELEYFDDALIVARTSGPPARRDPSGGAFLNPLGAAGARDLRQQDGAADRARSARAARREPGRASRSRCSIARARCGAAAGSRSQRECDSARCSRAASPWFLLSTRC
jgi:hypothetical protein